MMQPDVLQHLLELPKENLEQLLQMGADLQGPHPLKSAAPRAGASRVAHLLDLMSLHHECSPTAKGSTTGI